MWRRLSCLCMIIAFMLIVAHAKKHSVQEFPDSASLEAAEAEVVVVPEDEFTHDTVIKKGLILIHIC